MEMPFEIYLDPLLPAPWLVTIAAIAFLLMALSLKSQRYKSILRTLVVLLFIGVFLNPSFVEKERTKIKDIVAVIIDHSLSQSSGDRAMRTDQTLAYLQEKLENNPDLEIRLQTYPERDDESEETKLFEALEQAFSDVPVARRAGAILLTDGQIHDVPEAIQKNNSYGPVHALLSGSKNEKDRQILITQNPAYAIIGKPVQIKYKVVDTDNIRSKSARISVRQGNAEPELFDVPVGIEQTFDVLIEHAGKNVVEFKVDQVEDEITRTNNRAIAFVNGIRDRMRVLLVTGQPYAGGRTWRDLLKSDPNIDLVQFTILREPEKLDDTPTEEMALIIFPFRDLFEVKLHEFDLVIFDRYKLNRILPESYFENIKSYIEEGGALLDINGPGYAGDESLYNTALKHILPARPTGKILNAPFVPQLTPQGKLHPVTRELPNTTWGHWLHQTGVENMDGESLMSGINDTPLLILKRAGEGRIAQLSSDQIWLWARKYDGGGPHNELLRRLVHWLMKEPELDETLLNITTGKDQITIQSISRKDDAGNIEMTDPEGYTREISMERQPDGSYKTIISAVTPGIYSFKTPDKTEQYAIIGKMNAPELSALASTPDKIKNFAEMSGGRVLWMEETLQPSLKLLNTGAKTYGNNHTLAFRNNQNYEVRDFREIPFLNAWIGLLLLAAACLFTWWREGKN